MFVVGFIITFLAKKFNLDKLKVAVKNDIIEKTFKEATVCV